MARIRTIKPAFWGDEKTSQLTRDARLLFIGLISMADDQGRFLASHSAITGYVFPNDEDITPKRLAAWLDEITNSKMVILYHCARIRYGVIPHYLDHQKISHPSKSTLPDPPIDTLFNEDPY